MFNDDERRGRRPRRRGARAPGDGQRLEDKWFGSPWAEPEGGRASSDRRARQLCRQVRELLELAIAELEDPMLDGVMLLGVEQEPGGRSLRADLLVPGDRDLGVVIDRLAGVRGRLRSEIAAAIHRKRTPQLAFAVLPAAALAHDEEDGGDDA